MRTHYRYHSEETLKILLTELNAILSPEQGDLPKMRIGKRGGRYVEINVYDKKTGKDTTKLVSLSSFCQQIQRVCKLSPYPMNEEVKVIGKQLLGRLKELNREGDVLLYNKDKSLKKTTATQKWLTKLRQISNLFSSKLDAYKSLKKQFFSNEALQSNQSISAAHPQTSIRPATTTLKNSTKVVEKKQLLSLEKFNELSLDQLHQLPADEVSDYLILGYYDEKIEKLTNEIKSLVKEKSLPRDQKEVIEDYLEAYNLKHGTNFERAREIWRYLCPVSADQIPKLDFKNALVADKLMQKFNFVDPDAIISDIPPRMVSSTIFVWRFTPSQFTICLNRGLFENQDVFFTSKQVEGLDFSQIDLKAPGCVQCLKDICRRYHEVIKPKDINFLMPYLDKDKLHNLSIEQFNAIDFEKHPGLAKHFYEKGKAEAVPHLTLQELKEILTANKFFSREMAAKITPLQLESLDESTRQLIKSKFPNEFASIKQLLSLEKFNELSLDQLHQLPADEVSDYLILGYYDEKIEKLTNKIKSLVKEGNPLSEQGAVGVHLRKYNKELGTNFKSHLDLWSYLFPISSDQIPKLNSKNPAIMDKLMQKFNFQTTSQGYYEEPKNFPYHVCFQYLTSAQIVTCMNRGLLKGIWLNLSEEQLESFDFSQIDLKAPGCAQSLKDICSAHLRSLKPKDINFLITYIAKDKLHNLRTKQFNAIDFESHPGLAKQFCHRTVKKPFPLVVPHLSLNELKEILMNPKTYTFTKEMAEKLTPTQLSKLDTETKQLLKAQFPSLRISSFEP